MTTENPFELPNSNHHITDDERNEQLRGDSVTELSMDVLRRLEIIGLPQDERMMIIVAEIVGTAYDHGFDRGFQQGLDFEGTVEEGHR